MTCPKCHGEMRVYERSGVTVDQCTECRGIFLDRGELEKLFEAEANWNSQQAGGAPRPQQAVHTPPPAPHGGGYAPPPPPVYGAPGYPAQGYPPAAAYGQPVPQYGHHGHYRQHGHYNRKRRKGGFLGELFD